MGDNSRFSVPRQSLVPKPIFHFQRPRGGAGPRLQIVQTSAASNPSPNVPNIPNTTPSPLQSLGITSEQVAAIAEIVMAVQNKNNQNNQKTPKQASSTMNVSGTIKEQSRREKTPRRGVLVVSAQFPFQHKRDLMVLILGCRQTSHEFSAENRARPRYPTVFTAI